MTLFNLLVELKDELLCSEKVIRAVIEYVSKHSNGIGIINESGGVYHIRGTANGVNAVIRLASDKFAVAVISTTSTSLPYICYKCVKLDYGYIHHDDIFMTKESMFELDVGVLLSIGSCYDDMRFADFLPKMTKSAAR